MALAQDDRVKETSTTTGTGTYNLDGAVTGFQTFVAGIGSTNQCWYSATDGTNWEVGIGTVTDATPDTLSRDTILSSSNADSAVSWAAGTKTLACVLPATIGLNKGFSALRVYTTTGNTWTKPANLSFIIVEAVGGGGGGAGGGPSTAGSGGGAGGYARKTIAASALGASVTITLGTGGAGGTTGGAATAGASSVFGTFLTACGGAQGVTGGAAAGVQGGSGGLATSGDINIQGGDGGGAGAFMTAVSGGTVGTGVISGYGGASFFGGGPQGTAKSGTGASAIGSAGHGPGTGGAGGCGSFGGTASGASGGAGAAGVVLVWEFI